MEIPAKTAQSGDGAMGRGGGTLAPGGGNLAIRVHKKAIGDA